MIKVIDKIHQSSTYPTQTNVLWDDNGVLKIYRNGNWEPIVTSEEYIKSVLEKLIDIESSIQAGLLSSYIHIAYSNSSDGFKDFSQTDSEGKEYLGIYTDYNIQGSNEPSKYKWSKIKGDKGDKGDDGLTGPNGVDGAAGTNTYFHIKFSNDPKGKNMNDEDGIYIGTYVDEIKEDSKDPSTYSWKKLRGDDGLDGTQGIPGKQGENGKTSYLHIAYANSADGVEGFSVIDSADKIYVGQYVDFEINDSYEPSRYKWTRIKGAKGENAVQLYTWLKYADDVEIDHKTGLGISGIGISDSPFKEDGTFKKYIGFAYNKTTAEESKDYKDYKWNLSAGADGEDGIPGESGYTWIKYSDVDPTNTINATIYDEPKESTTYIGIVTNKPTKEESKDPSDYKWSNFKGAPGIPGEKGDKGDDGKSYEYIYKLTNDKNDIPDTKGMPSDNIDEYIPSGWGWKDSPSGVSEINKAEWCCIRKKIEGIWSGWEGPSLWSVYGETGKDGGDLQYIYKRTITEDAPEYPAIPEDYLTNEQYQELGGFANTEYCPTGWSDNPQGVSKVYPYEWCCIRKKRNGVWLDYSQPALWGKYGLNGNSLNIKNTVDDPDDLPTPPEDPSDCYIIDNELYIWLQDIQTWKNVGNFKGEDGDSIEWKGEFATAPLNPQNGWMYKNTKTGTVYIYKSEDASWHAVVRDGDAGWVLNLSNDNDSVNCDATGKIVDTTKPVCKAELYHGDVAITNGVSFSIVIDDSKVNGITISSTGELKFADGYSFYNKVIRIKITAKATQNSTVVATASKIFTLSKNIPGKPGEDAVKYYLKPSANMVVLDKDGKTLTPSSVSVECYKQVGNNQATLDTSQTIYYDYDSDTPTNTLAKGGSVTATTDMNYICFALKNDKGEFYEAEKIHLVKNGKDGANGTSVNIIDTLDSIDELPKEEPENLSDAYRVGSNLYMWGTKSDGTKGWKDLGPFGQSAYLHTAYADDDKGTNFSTTNSKGRSYIGTYADEIVEDSTEYNDYNWTKLTGNGIENVIIEYGISTSSEEEPSSWSTEYPKNPSQGYYVWERRTTTYTDGKTTIEYFKTYYSKDGVSVKSVITYYTTTETLDNYPEIKDANIGTGDGKWNDNTDELTFNSTYNYLYSFTRTILEDDSYIDTTPNLVNKYASDGKTVYPAGLYSTKTTYTSTDTTAPYVIFGSDYYQLNTDSWKGSDHGNADPASDIAAGNTNWIKFDKYKAVFAEIGLINNGKFGSAVFSGDYMFSQYGTTTIDGVVQGNYENFNHDDPFGPNNSFYPTVCFNFLTGETWLGKNKITLDGNGNVKLGDFNITEGGLNYEVDDSHLSINKDGITIKNISDGSIVQQISTDGDALLSNGTTSFMSDKTGNISDNKITWDSNSIKFLNAFTIYSNGDVINNQNAYVDLHSLDSMWPLQDVSVERAIPHASDIYMYNSVRFTNAHIETDLHILTFNLRLSFKIGKVIKIHIANDLGCIYNINVNFSDYNNNIDYDILGTLYISNGNLVMPSLNRTAKSFSMKSGCTHVFVCEEMSGSNVLHYYGAFDS